jgi:hypothetical protein
MFIGVLASLPSIICFRRDTFACPGNEVHLYARVYVSLEGGECFIFKPRLVLCLSRRGGAVFKVHSRFQQRERVAPATTTATATTIKHYPSRGPPFVWPPSVSA